MKKELEKFYTYLSPGERRVFDKLYLLGKEHFLVSRRELTAAIWGDLPPKSRVLDVHLLRIRQALALHSVPLELLTVWGFGWKLNAKVNQTIHNRGEERA